MPIKRELYDYWGRFHKSIPHPSNYPIITNVQASPAFITWDTDVESTSQVIYGPTPNLGFITDYSAALVTSHSVQLVNIVVPGIYYLKVMSFHIDALSISDLYVFEFTNSTNKFDLEDDTGDLLSEDGTPILQE